MPRRYKTTGCARFFFFMIIFIPIIYFGLQFFAKDDTRVQEMKEWVDNTVDKIEKNKSVEKIIKKKKESNTPISKSNSELEQEIVLLKEELFRQEQLILELRKEIEALKNE